MDADDSQSSSAQSRIPWQIEGSSKRELIARLTDLSGDKKRTRSNSKMGNSEKARQYHKLTKPAE